MRKLRVKTDDGYAWVFGRRMPSRELVTTPHKAQALPPHPIHGPADLEWAKKTWPDREFSLSETL